MKVTVVRPTELGPGEVARWRSLQRANPALGNPFLSPEFTLAVGRARDTARVAVIEEGPEVVGFFPHELRGRLVGTAIGAGISDSQALIHAPGFEWSAKELVQACGLPVWEFDHLVANQTPFAEHHALRLGSPVMDLSAGFATYLAERERATSGVKDLRRKMRKLEREVGELRFAYEVTDPEMLQTLMDWKSAQYRRTRVFDRFAAPWIVQAVRELLGAAATECTGTFSVLYAGERPLAAHFGIRSASVLSYWFPAYDVDFGRYSPGLGLLLRIAEAAADGGVRQVDLGRGQTRYKDELKSRELPIAEGRVGVSWPVTAARRTHTAFTQGVHQLRRRRPLRHVRRLGQLVLGRTTTG